MAVTRRDFEAIASVFQANRITGTNSFELGHENARLNLIAGLADYFEQANPNFDRRRFLIAAGWPVLPLSGATVSRESVKVRFGALLDTFECDIAEAIGDA